MPLSCCRGCFGTARGLGLDPHDALKGHAINGLCSLVAPFHWVAGAPSVDLIPPCYADVIKCHRHGGGQAWRVVFPLGGGWGGRPPRRPPPPPPPPPPPRNPQPTTAFSPP